MLAIPYDTNRIASIESISMKLNRLNDKLWTTFVQISSRKAKLLLIWNDFFFYMEPMCLRDYFFHLHYIELQKSIKKNKQEMHPSNDVATGQ